MTEKSSTNLLRGTIICYKQSLTQYRLYNEVSCQRKLYRVSGYMIDIIPMFKLSNQNILIHLSGQNRQKNNSLKECVFINGTQITVLYCQKYTPTDGFFGDFTHWDPFSLVY